MNKGFSIPKKNMLRKHSCKITWNRRDGGGLRNFLVVANENNSETDYRGADKSLARPTSRCILFDGENISFDASLVI
jgi:hypothetical protein